MLVEGIRGAGKSFWWHALQNPKLRPERTGSLEVTAGFGLGASADWPEKDELVELLRLGHPPRFIWKSVVLRQVAPVAVPTGDWGALVQWVRGEPSKVAEIVRTADARLRDKQLKHVILFDALDRTADTAKDRQMLLRGLLELVLEMRALRAIRAKVFVRPDMLDDPQVKAFPDASKVVASRVQLDWTSVDLYGLLFTYLGNGTNAESAKVFRTLTKLKWDQAGHAGWSVPSVLRTDSDAQDAVFVNLAGPWMGTNKRRGKTYTWIPNHLSDAFGNVSPRSFLAAVLRAAEVPQVAGHEYPLHWTGLQEGVRKASEYRVAEVAEDLPWAHTAMKMLADVVVPCSKNALLTAWREQNLRSELEKNEFGDQLHSDLGEILRQLEAVGILAPLSEDRINIPDVYRVGFGLRRKGGFAPG
jgi:hypothetical protein